MRLRAEKDNGLNPCDAVGSRGGSTCASGSQNVFAPLVLCHKDNKVTVSWSLPQG